MCFKKLFSRLEDASRPQENVQDVAASGKAYKLDYARPSDVPKADGTTITSSGGVLKATGAGLMNADGSNAAWPSTAQESGSFYVQDSKGVNSLLPNKQVVSSLIDHDQMQGYALMLANGSNMIVASPSGSIAYLMGHQTGATGYIAYTRGSVGVSFFNNDANYAKESDIPDVSGKLDANGDNLTSDFIKSLISTDSGNQLTQGSDGRLTVPAGK